VRARLAPGHYPLIVALHAAWLAGLWYLAAGAQDVA
jgi:methyltransferase